MIPKVIHYCCFGGKKLPLDAKKCIRSWQEKCPDYEIVQWNESNFDINMHPFTKTAWESKAWAFVSDYARLKLIFEYGGIYLDTDVQLIKNLDPLLKNQFYIGIQQNRLLCTTGLGFGATKENDVVYRMLQVYDQIDFLRTDKMQITCPWLNDSVIRSYGEISCEEPTYLEQVTVFPPRYFDPYGGQNLLCNETYSIHHYSASWTKSQNRLKRKIARCIGQNYIIKIKEIMRRTK